MTNNDLFFLMKVQYQDLEESLEKYLEEADAGNTFFQTIWTKIAESMQSRGKSSQSDKRLCG